MLTIVIIALLTLNQPTTKPLTITGDTITVVRSFPITITAPPNADYYSWNVPSNVQHTKSKNVLTITSAQGGELKVSVECVTWKIDFEKKTKDVVTEAFDTTMIVGMPNPPTPPTPPTPTGLVKALKDAYVSSPGSATERTDFMLKLAALYRQAPKILTKVKTSGELQTALIEARRIDIPDIALVPVRKVIAEELAKVLPKDLTAPYGDPARVTALFSTIESALVEAIK